MRIDKNKLKIQGMFSEIATTYDRANTILSLGLHHSWKKRLIHTAVEESKGGKVLDICTGTGDILNGLLKLNVPTFGIDFTLAMLKLQKSASLDGIRYAQADALQLPFPDHCFQVITVSYGIRNFESLSKGLKEILRVLKPGGTLLILEFGKKPLGIISNIISIYENTILPFLGGIISGKSDAYKYLANSSHHFPSGSHLITECKQVGFKDGSVKAICFGATYLYKINTHKM